MTARNYDYVIKVDDSILFRPGRAIYGNTSGTVGFIANVNYTTNNLKIKVENVISEFIIGEYCYSSEDHIQHSNLNVFASCTYTSFSGSEYRLPDNANITSDTEIYIYYTPTGSSTKVALPREAYIWPSPTYGKGGIYFKKRHSNPTGNTQAAQHRELSFALGENVIVTTTSGRVYNGDHPFIRGLNRIDRENYKRYQLDYTYFTSTDPISTIAFGADYTVTWPTSGTGNVSSLIVTTVRNNLECIPYENPTHNSNAVTGISRIASISPSAFIRETHSFQQKPLVRLYTIYYPGEWYFPNDKGNPTNEGAGRPWPYGFPYRFAEIRGDIISDVNYRVLHNNLEYLAYPIDSTGISLSSTGEVNEINITVSNFDGVVAGLVENRRHCGNCSSGITAVVNGEYVTNMDARTVVGNPSFNSTIATSRGGTNLAHDYDSCIAVGGTWTSLKPDSRDLLGAVVEIRSTFANFLDVWPEYSTVKQVSGANVILWTGSPYRAGDLVRSNTSSTLFSVSSIRNNILTLNTASHGITAGQRVYIHNPDADPDSYVLDTFKIDSLDGLDDKFAKFSLTSWLQYFKLTLPKRKFYKNTCPWLYHGPECQYPRDGASQIPGTLLSANGFFDLSNAPSIAANDACAHTEEACTIRNNRIHFGGFPGTGRNMPK